MKDKKAGGAGFWRLEEELPWLTKNSVEFIKKYMSKEHMVLEFGAGASTVFFSKYARKVYSFESGGYSTRKGNLDRSLDWFKQLSVKFKNSGVDNVELYLLQGYPNSEVLYDRLISSFTDSFFDWVLVDGANRNLCIDKTRSKLKPGGCMIIDNYTHECPPRFLTDVKLHREKEYCVEVIKELLSEWEEFVFDEPGWAGSGTIIFKKP